MIFNHICFFCNKEFQSKIAYDLFCCGSCSIDYYNLPKEERTCKITTTCPKCKRKYLQDNVPLEAAHLIALGICQECSNKNQIMVGNNKKWI